VVSVPAPIDVPAMQTSDQAADNAVALLPVEAREPLASKVWKERLDAVTKLAELCASGLDLSNPLAGNTVVQLLQATPGWKESNFQVVQAMLTCFVALAERDPAFSISTAAIAIPLIVDKLGDVKLSAPATAALTAFAVALGPLRVLEHVHVHAHAHRNSKVKSGACQWLTDSLRAFGAAVLPWADVVPLALTSMEDPRAKPEAVALLCAARQYAGSDAAVFARTGDIKPALRTALEAEFAKAALVAAPAPTLQTRRSGALVRASAVPAPRHAATTAAPAAAPAAATAAVAVTAPTVRGERADISALLTPALFDQLAAAKWSDRDEAMARLSSLIGGAGGNQIVANVKELPMALAARLTDSNKNLRVRACALVGQLGAALGAEGELAASHLLPTMLTLLADNRVAMRDAVCAALDAWYHALGLSALAPYLGTPLTTGSSIVRRTLLTWLDQCTTSAPPPASPQLALAVPGLLAAAEDRNADVRQLVHNALLMCVSAGVPFDAIMRAIDDLRPASVAALHPLVESLAARAGVPLPARRSAVPRTPSRSGLSSSPGSVSATPQRKSPIAASTPMSTRPTKPGTAVRTQPRPVVAATPKRDANDADDADADDDEDDFEVQVNMGARPIGTLSSAALAAASSKRANAFVIETSDSDDLVDDVVDDDIDDGHDGDDDDDDAGGAVNEPPPTVIDEVVLDGDAQVESEAAGMQRQALAWLDTVRAGEPSGVIETLKLWCSTMATEDAVVLLPSLDAMCAALAALLPSARAMLETDGGAALPAGAAGVVSSAPGARFYKYLLNAIKTVFATRSQAQLVAAHTLECTLRELLSGLVQPVLRAHADGEILMVAINQLVISVLEFADLSQALLALMRLLTATSHSSAHPLRLSETIARALLKLAKAKLTSADQARALDVDNVMLELHRFLERHPPHAWRADANFELRAVKTLLHTIVSALGDGVREHLKLVPLDRAQPPVLVDYVHVMLSDRKRRQSSEPSDAESEPSKHAPAATRENIAPNAPVDAATAAAAAAAAGNEAYLSRLRSLQQKYGLRSNAAAAAEPADGAEPINAAETPAAAAASSTSIAELRARLARIKATSMN
jgi:hypothetical protein